MKRIGLISDTHGYVHPKLCDFLKDVDELWHAGDIGNAGIIEPLSCGKTFRGVSGNIDGPDVWAQFQEENVFMVEDVKVAMLHIGGYPRRYSAKARKLIQKEKPDIFISGHSHILKAMYDDKNKLLHLNPGAAGRQGFHKVISFMRFIIDGKEIRNLEVADYPRS